MILSLRIREHFPFIYVFFNFFYYIFSSKQFFFLVFLCTSLSAPCQLLYFFYPYFLVGPFRFGSRSGILPQKDGCSSTPWGTKAEHWGASPRGFGRLSVVNSHHPPVPEMPPPRWESLWLNFGSPGSSTIQHLWRVSMSKVACCGDQS